MVFTTAGTEIHHIPRWDQVNPSIINKDFKSQIHHILVKNNDLAWEIRSNSSQEDKLLDFQLIISKTFLKKINNLQMISDLRIFFNRKLHQYPKWEIDMVTTNRNHSVEYLLLVMKGQMISIWSTHLVVDQL